MVGFLCFEAWGDGGESMKRIFTVLDLLGVWPGHLSSGVALCGPQRWSVGIGDMGGFEGADMTFYISCQGGVREYLKRTYLQLGTGTTKSRPFIPPFPSSLD